MACSLFKRPEQDLSYRGGAVLARRNSFPAGNRPSQRRTISVGLFNDNDVETANLAGNESHLRRIKSPDG
jgi:hypothetical protein